MLISSYSLRSRGEGKGSDDMFTFHQAVAEVVEAEERVVEEHRAVIQVRSLYGPTG